MSGRSTLARGGDEDRPLPGRLAGADGLLVGLDFDGTVAPIAEDPDEPTIGRACRRAIGRLAARPDARVAVVSGRALDDLRGRVGLDGLVYAGNHGLELHRGDRTAVHPLAARRRPALARALGRLREELADVPGVVIEDKGLTGTVHVRRTPPERHDDVRSAVANAARSAGSDLRLTSGREVFEFRPDVAWDKGSAMSLLADGMPTGWRSVYVGDDVTDEDAFRAVRPDGLGVLVGSRAPTAATRRLPTRAGVAPFLHQLVDAVLGRQATTRS